jgi:hypothetical protein
VVASGSNVVFLIEYFEDRFFLFPGIASNKAGNGESLLNVRSSQRFSCEGKAPPGLGAARGGGATYVNAATGRALGAARRFSKLSLKKRWVSLATVPR